jgi:hypothetical protein
LYIFLNLFSYCTFFAMTFNDIIFKLLK